MDQLKKQYRCLIQLIDSFLKSPVKFIKELQLLRFLKYYIYVVWAFIILGIAFSILLIPIWIIFFPVFLIVYLLAKIPFIETYVHQGYLIMYDWIFYKSNYPRKILWRFIYDSMCLFYSQSKWRAMNYGYAKLSEDGIIQNDSSKDEIFCFQLYYFVASNHEQEKQLKNKTIVEIGCGRGGGLNYISQTMQPKKCIGVDISDQQVQFCRTNYNSNKNLEFYQSDAESFSRLPEIPKEEVDVIINIESSHCYSNFNQFIQEVTRVLKKGGMLQIADFREISEINKWENDLTSTGLVMRLFKKFCLSSKQQKDRISLLMYCML